MIGPLRAVVLDLDETIVDSSSLADLRRSRQWKSCAQRFGTLSCYPSILETIAHIRHSGIKIGIVTSSVSFYAAGLLSHFQVSYDKLIAYHDVSPRKPHPAPVLACIGFLDVLPHEAIGIGDAAIDCEAYKSAGIAAYGAGWSPSLDQTAEWTSVITSPGDLLKLMEQAR